MSTVEKDKCNFCNEVKPVLRKYVNSKIGDTFVIVRYCKECGIEDNDPREDVIKYLKKKMYVNPQGIIIFYKAEFDQLIKHLSEKHKDYE